jgi:hypothetical protein
VIVAVTDEVPRILTTDLVADPGLPFGPLDPVQDRTLELGLRGWVSEQTGLGLGYVEQLYTFGDDDQARDPRGDGAGRFISVAYLALVREVELSAGVAANWSDIYLFLPWEDWRNGKPRILDQLLLPALETFIDSEARLAPERRERVQIAFGLQSSAWDEERVLDRYELIYEAGLAGESHRRSSAGQAAAGRTVGVEMALDHRRMLATALGRLRGKLKYRPVVFELMPEAFTLLQLQRVVEALSGVRLHKQNFRRLVERGGLVEGTGKYDDRTGGRPAEMFRFRPQVLRERPTPGLGLPGARSVSASTP